MFYILNIEAPLPSRHLVLRSTESKTHLTQLLIKYRLLTFETCLKENSFYMTSEETKKKVKRAIIQEYKDIMSEDEEAQANYVIKAEIATPKFNLRILMCFIYCFTFIIHKIE